MMTYRLKTLTLGLGISLGLLCQPLSAQSEAEAIAALETTVRTIEERLQARVGLRIEDSASGWSWEHRAQERYLMASTFKTLLCGAVLERVDAGKLSLDEPLVIDPAETQSYAPVTKGRGGEEMPISALCYATLDMSDNGAANLLLNRLGGPQEVTAFLRRIGDETTRLDRKEPDLNVFVAGDPRDTTSPAAMLATWRTLLLGDALRPASRQLLAEWMRDGGVTGNLIRASTPETWQVVDKSGGGLHHTRNLVAMITPPDRAPYFVAIYLSDTPADWDTRNAAVAEIGKAVIAVIEAR